MPKISFKVNPEHAKMTEIVPGLFICGVSALNPMNMAKHKITHIINATNEVPNLKSLGNIQRSKLWLDDTPQTYIYPHLELQSDQIQAIIADGGQVLVHCVAGVSRSASICLAYLTKYKCRSLRDAYHLMASKRPMVRPNLGFWRQLIAFEQVRFTVILSSFISSLHGVYRKTDRRKQNAFRVHYGNSDRGKAFITIDRYR
uniref:Protein-tyrosine-phosphatase n=1 Tax=Parascaris univalens TaxID=6257 RepID=A0A915AAN4_PARUN